MQRAAGGVFAARVKRVSKVILQDLGLLRPALRVRERMLAARSSGHERQLAPDGMPVPPAVLRMRVAGTGDFDWFLQGGERAEAAIRAILGRHGARPEQFGAMLDFGCGCGRVTRRWSAHAGVQGCDPNAEAIAWCSAHLTFGEFAMNGDRPPLRYPDAAFDFVYALSVFTHLAVDRQGAWMRELRRVLRPGGWLLITTHGAGFTQHLAQSERGRYDAGELVVRWQGVAGSNLCSAFHPEGYLRGPFSAGFEVLEFDSRGALGNPPQDQVLLRKPAA